MFLRAVCLLRLLKALVASTSITASIFGEFQISFIVWMAASQPTSCPAQSCNGPAAFLISSFSTAITAQAMILLNVSPMPMGLTPGHLSSAINRHATNVLRLLGSTKVVHICLVTEATAAHRSLDGRPKEEQILFQEFASNPEGPVAHPF